MLSDRYQKGKGKDVNYVIEERGWVKLEKRYKWEAGSNWEPTGMMLEMD
jgi:hypothetical protein